MKIRLLLIIIASVILPKLSSQSVGLVLSGGGAKGLAHIGIIKALEENSIPIDFVSGTSMGAIIGALYSMGYSPDEMIAVFKSKDFEFWSNGIIEEKYHFLYKALEPEPDFAKIRINLKDSTKILPLLPTSIIDPNPMNIGFIRLFSQATAQCKNNFDSLFVPFRCVASDVYNNKAVIFKEGDLGESVRASMTIPFIFKPITIDQNLLFDGGIYNNFPVDVMQNTFHPDFIIGSSVVGNTEKPDDENIYLQVLNMIMAHETEYEVPDTKGIHIKNNFPDVGLLDFAKIDKVVEMGYQSALPIIQKIKSQVKREQDTIALLKKRTAWKNETPPLLFKGIQFRGLSGSQARFISQVFTFDSAVFTFQDFQDTYYKLLADDKISEINPRTIYNEDDGYFTLNLDFKLDKDVNVLLGGNITTGSNNQSFIGFEHKSLSRTAATYYGNLHFGRLYNGGKLGVRFDFPSGHPIALSMDLVIHRWDYYKNYSNYFFEEYSPSFFKLTENRFSVGISTPISYNSIFETTVDIASESSKYLQNSDLSNPIFDQTDLNILNITAKYERKKLNSKQYPTKGTNISLKAGLTTGNENFFSGVTGETRNNISNLFIPYTNLKYDKYFSIAGKFSTGLFTELLYSAYSGLSNITSTYIHSPSFTPTPFSRNLYIEEYRAPMFIGAGIKPIWSFNQFAHLRGEIYGFLPVIGFDTNANRTASEFSIRTISMASLVYKLPVGEISFSVNHFSAPKSQFFFSVDFGYLIFNRKALL